MDRFCIQKIVIGLIFWSLCAFAPRALGEDMLEATPAPASSGSNAQAKTFDEVLTDLLNEFAYDLKTNALTEVSNVSVRRVALNESIPKSYESYLESMVVERFRTSSKIRVIHCTTCRTKKSIVENGKLHITIPINNPAELDRISQQLNINNWVDVALLYQETNMVFALNIFDAKSKELIWTKVYNSESIYRKRASQDLGGDTPGEPGATGTKKPKQEEEPERFVFGLGLGYANIPNVKGRSNMLAVPIRASERFADGHAEIGALLLPLLSSELFLSTYKNVDGDPVATGEAKESQTTEAINPFKAGLGLFATYHHNFFTGKEVRDGVRFGIMTGFGPVVSTGYLSLTGRAGLLLKFGRHFVVDGGVMYSAPTTISIKKKISYKTKGGVGGDIAFGILL